MSNQEQSCPLPRVRGYFQLFYLGYPEVVEAVLPMRVLWIRLKITSFYKFYNKTFLKRYNFKGNAFEHAYFLPY